MSYSLEFLPQAENEIIEAINWYNSEKDNLGFEFYNHLSEKLILLSQHPLHYSIRFKESRASKLSKFPYLIYFKVDKENSRITIIGVLHTSRNPNEIKKRK